MKVVALVCLKQTVNFLTNNHPISPRLQRCFCGIAFMTCTGPADVLKKCVPAVLLWDQLTVLLSSGYRKKMKKSESALAL